MASLNEINALADAYFFLAAAAANVENTVKCWKIQDRKEFGRHLEALQK